ncbi:MAG TPA: AAA family ATPase [Stellaceae bacterium]|nr:AAA family ATPase [Stellaceae bacterium]
MSAGSAAAVAASPPTGKKAEREGIVTILQDQATLDRVQSITRELQLDDELIVEPSLDSALGRVREGMQPRVLLLDLSDSAAPIAEISAARAVAGMEVKILALGTVNDVTLFRDLLAAGANDYLVKPPSRESLASALEKPQAGGGGGSGGLGQVIAFIGSRGGVGTTTVAVSCAWLLAEQHKQRTALVDLDLHFGTVALYLDTDPGSGLCEALEQPSRIDSLFVERAMVKVSDTLRILAAEAPVGDPQMIDTGAIDVLLYELRRKFAWVIIDLPRAVTPTQRVVLAAASRVVMVCDRSLSGLRDTIRLQTLIRERAPQTQLMLLDAGATGDRAAVGKSEFEKAAGKTLDGAIPYDVKAAAAAANSGQPLPLAAPRSAITKELQSIAGTLAGPAEAPKKRKIGIGRW